MSKATQQARAGAGLVLALALGLAGCSTAYNLRGIEPTVADNPDVLVTADDEKIHFPQASTLLTDNGYVLRPPLSVSFERVLERYVSRGRFRITYAKISSPDPSNLGALRLTLVVFSDQRSYTLQADHWYGLLGNTLPKDLPSFLDACARQLAAALRDPRQAPPPPTAATIGAGPPPRAGPRPP